MGGIYTLVARQPCTSANLQICTSARATPTTLVISSEVLYLLCGCHDSQWQRGRSLPSSTALLQVSNAVPVRGDSHEASPSSQPSIHPHGPHFPLPSFSFSSIFPTDTILFEVRWRRGLCLLAVSPRH
jgi:hypothetical protein